MLPVQSKHFAITPNWQQRFYWLACKRKDWQVRCH